MIRAVLKRIASWVDVETYDRARAHSILRGIQPQLRTATICQRREAVWDTAIARIGPRTPVLYLEFGVFEGYSLTYFAERLAHPASRFYGFDSFEGLPERWGDYEAGKFSTHGRPPEASDPRISFVKGWFQDTVPGFLGSPDAMPQSGGEDMVLLVHFDADLYSSTLFLLALLWQRYPGYFFCFDEFMGHEIRAVRDFSTAFPSEIDYSAYDLEFGFPTHVFGSLRRARVGPR